VLWYSEKILVPIHLSGLWTLVIASSLSRRLEANGKIEMGWCKEKALIMLSEIERTVARCRLFQIFAAGTNHHSEYSAFCNVAYLLGDTWVPNGTQPLMSQLLDVWLSYKSKGHYPAGQPPLPAFPHNKVLNRAILHLPPMQLALPWHQHAVDCSAQSAHRRISWVRELQTSSCGSVILMSSAHNRIRFDWLQMDFGCSNWTV
jgi:hypothetical protein